MTKDEASDLRLLIERRVNAELNLAKASEEVRLAQCKIEEFIYKLDTKK